MEEEEVDGIVYGDLIVCDVSDSYHGAIGGEVDFVNLSSKVDSGFEAPGMCYICDKKKTEYLFEVDINHK